MICKEDVVCWFKELESYERIDTMCTLLNMCLPFELRFLGTCLEELGRRDSQELRGIELRVNNPVELAADISSCRAGDPTDIKIRRRMALYLALIRVSNRSSVTEIFQTLEVWGDKDLYKFGDGDPLQELLLVYTMAANHPVFSFEQRMKCGEICNKIHECTKVLEGPRQTEQHNFNQTSSVQPQQQISPQNLTNSMSSPPPPSSHPHQLNQQPILVLPMGFNTMTQQTLNPVENKASNGHCVWYGVCKEIGNHKLYCAYNGTAKPVDDEGKQLLSTWCPHLLDEHNNNVCCDNQQIAVLNENVKLAATFLKRCPSCLSNLVKHLCEFTCASNQSNFLAVTKTEVAPDKREYVTAVDFHITEQYLNGTYSSCSQVSFPSSGQLALDLMCGQWSASRCSPARWFEFMGDAKTNAYVPFQITYLAQNGNQSINGFTPLDPKITPCSEALDAKTPACSCVDCEASCPKPPPVPPIPKPFSIGGLDGYAIIMLIVFLVGSALFLLGVCVFPSKRSIEEELVQGDPARVRSANVGRRLASRRSSGTYFFECRS